MDAAPGAIARHDAVAWAYARGADQGGVEIHQQIVVMRDNQRAIVLGKGGSRIKEIGKAAREELSELLGQKVHLFLHVKNQKEVL